MKQQTSNNYIIKGNMVCLNNSNVTIQISRNIPENILKLSKDTAGNKSQKGKYKAAVHRKLSKN